MRDYVLTAVVFALVPVCFARPWLGILTWYWLGLMNPHRLTWEFAYTMPFAMLVGGATLLGAVFARDRRPIPWERELVLTAVLFAYFIFTSFFAWAPRDAWAHVDKVGKIILMTFVATMFIYGKVRIRYLMLVVVFSLGYYGLKGGIWSIIHGGAEAVQGPEGSFIEGNTFISLALNMVIPLMVALARTEERPWLRRFLYVLAGLSAISSLFSYSRGGWLGLAVVVLLLLFQLKPGTRVMLLSVLIAVALTAHSVLPERVFTRAGTFENIDEDCSANERLMSWTVHWNVAKRYPLTGAGFQFENAEDGRYLTFGDPKYAECFTVSSSAAHSIYFQILGQHGFIAFFIYMLLLISVQLKLNRLRRESKRQPETAWIGTYALGIQIGLLSYMVSGAFLSSAYFDLAWLYYAVTVILSRELATQTAQVPVRHAPATRPNTSRNAQVT
jgi:probable O-glycosylation ligase (exosortase A-associated)